MHGRGEKCIHYFGWKTERKGPPGRIVVRREDNIRIDAREIGLDSVDWIHLTQDRDQWQALVNTIMNFRVP